MASRIFALIIGIDTYKSGDIWNLDSCVNDAQKMKRWLLELGVPRRQISLLLDQDATRQSIIDAFSSHFLHNDSVQEGDAVFVYFAGHGSSIPAPFGWYPSFHGSPSSVELLCPHDHDTKDSSGHRIAGISDRLLHSLLDDVALHKSDNITVVLDSCFSPTRSPANIRNRGSIRWTNTTKSLPQDLYKSIPRSSSVHRSQSEGFLSPSLESKSRILVACSQDEAAFETTGRGGAFTAAFIAVVNSISLHRSTYSDFMKHLVHHMKDMHQHPLHREHYSSSHKVIFDGVPFKSDSTFIPIQRMSYHIFRIEAGTMHGVVNGDRIPVHLHNFSGSHNPCVGTLIATDVYDTWTKCSSENIRTSIQTAWARISKRKRKLSIGAAVRSAFLSAVHRNIEYKPSQPTTLRRVSTALRRTRYNVTLAA